MADGVGIDLIEIDRLERALEKRPLLAGRLFSEAELAYAGERARPARHLAARFAAKEAVVKALGHSGGLGLGEVEVLAGEPPRVRLSGSAAKAAGERTIRISMTHSRDLASAVAIVG